MAVSPAMGTRKIASSLYLLVMEFVDYRRAFSDEFDSAATAEVEKARRITEISASDFIRICPVLYEAARCYHSVRLAPILRTCLKGRNTVRAARALAITLAVAYAAYQPPRPSWGELNLASIELVLVPLVFVYLIGTLAAGYFAWRSLTILMLFAAVADNVALYQHKKWDAYVQPAWRRSISDAPLLHHDVKTALVVMPVVPAAQLLLWLLNLIFALVLIQRFIQFNMRMLYSPVGPYNRAAQQSAELIVGLIEVASFADKITKRIRTELGAGSHPVPDQELGWESNSRWQPLSNAERSEFNSMMAGLARLVRHRWVPAMASRYGPAGQCAASYGPRIELFLRQQQLENMLIGNNIFELRKEMALAIVQAADGDWQLIGSSCPEFHKARLLVDRWRRILRKILGISAPLIVAGIVGHFLKGISPGYIQSIILTCVVFSGVQLLYAIDPDAPSRLDIAGRLTSLFK